MEHITSADGTRIAVQHSGDGPALLLVVGAFCDRTSTASLAAGLTDHFTVCEYDRRGRGDSGNQPGYAIEREIEDLTAVVALDTVGPTDARVLEACMPTCGSRVCGGGPLPCGGDCGAMCRSISGAADPAHPAVSCRRHRRSCGEAGERAHGR